jgi:membrane protein implicated in regulation of membrane protease activity
MCIGTSLFLIAIGAILRWAVTVHASGFNIQLAGLIILIVGLVISLYLWFSRRPRRGTFSPEADRRSADGPPEDRPPTA